MKTFVFLLIISFSFSSFTQHSTGIYKLTWRIDKRLTTAFRMETQNQGVIQDVHSFRMPDHHRDAVIEQTISIVNELLNTNSHLVYRKRKNGNQIATYASQEYVGGLPRSTKKKAIKEFEQNLWVWKFHYSFQIIQKLSIKSIAEAHEALFGTVQLQD